MFNQYFAIFQTASENNTHENSPKRAYFVIQFLFFIFKLKSDREKENTSKIAKCLNIIEDTKNI